MNDKLQFNSPLNGVIKLEFLIIQSNWNRLDRAGYRQGKI